MVKIQIFELMGSILVDDNGVESHLDNIDKKGQSTSKSMGLSFSNIGKAALVAGAAIVTGLGAALVSGMKDAADAELHVAQLEAVLKSTGGSAGMTKDSLLKMAEGFEKTTKFSAEMALEAESLLLTFTNIGKDTFPRATKAAGDMATALGTDMAGQSIALGKALNDPTKGITALTRVGVTFTDEQKKSIKVMQEHGDMAGAQTIILKELEKEFGGSAEAAGKTFAGQLEILKNSFGAVTESLATKFMPYLQKFMDWVTVNLPTIQAIFSKAFDIVAGVLKVTYDFIKDNVIPMFVKLYDWVQPYIPQIKEIFQIAFDAIKAVLKVTADYVNNVLIPIYAALAKWFFDNFPKIKDAVLKAYDYIKPHFDQLVKVVKEDLMPIIMGLWDLFKKAMPGIQSVFEIVFKILVFVIGLVLDIIGEFIKAVKGIYDFIKPGLDLLTNIFNITFGGIKKIIEGVQWVLDKFNGTPAKDKNSTVTTNYVESRSYALGGTTGYASGTGYATPGAHWVGEDGPEIVNFKGGETVTNARDSAKVGGLTLTIDTFINNRKEDIEELAQELSFFMKQKDAGSGGVT